MVATFVKQSLANSYFFCFRESLVIVSDPEGNN